MILLNPKNLYAVFRDQLPLKRLWHNISKGNIKGLLHIRSHVNHAGPPKVMYNTKASADKAAASMMKKKPDQVFKSYKCLYCTGYHTGKNRLEKDIK